MRRSGWTPWSVLILLLSVASGCGVSPPSVRPGADSNADAGVVGEAACWVVVTPDGALLAETERAAERWSEATGCDVRVGEGGVPIVAWPRLFVEYTADGRALLADINHGGTMKPLCGLSSWTEDESAVRIIDVSLACDVGDAVTHELGHALAGLKRHSFTGMMAAGDNPARSRVIDAASLELVCYQLPCAAPSPEG
jgi:hypothetical protein